MKRFFSFLALVLLLVLAACGGNDKVEDQEANSNDKEEVTDKADMKIGLAVNTLNNPFFVELKEVAEETAEEEGIELVVTDSQEDPGK